MSKSKLMIKILLGKEPYIRRQINRKTEIFGHEGGCFPVQIEGVERDAALIVYSFGVGEDLSFSEHVLNTFPNATVYAFDPTPKAQRYVERHALSSNPRFHFFKYGISSLDGTEEFYLPKNENYVSGSIIQYDGVDESNCIAVEMKTLQTIMKELEHTHIDILKMDIEGSEFKVLQQISGTTCAFSQLCVEFHQRFFQDGKKKLRDLIRQLNQNGYWVARVLDSGEEVLFVK